MDKKEQLFRLAIKSYKKSDESIWVTAFACGNVVGNYDRGVSMGLASDMGCSVDTIEDLAHAYLIYQELCNYEDEGKKYRQFVRQARKASYIYYSHFRALWDAKSQYKLTTKQVLDLLMDVVQAEGTISSRGVDGHTRGRYGDTRGWEYYAQRTQKELGQTLQQPDLPNLSETIGNLYKVSAYLEKKLRTMYIVAANPQRAESIARKEAGKTIDPKIVRKMKFETEAIGPTLTDSKNLLSMTYSWLGQEG